MKKTFFLSLLLTVLLCSCEDDYHYNVKIINNSDKTVVITGSIAGSSIIGSSEADVTFSWIFNKISPVNPHSESMVDMNPFYFEKFDHVDRLRLYFIDKDVFNAAGGNPNNLNPDDYLGYIDLSPSEAKEVNWTVRFPDDTINNMQEEE